MHAFSLSAKDLSAEAPRSPRVRIGEYAILARTLDKGRASLAGTLGEYLYGCPLDKKLFAFKGLTGHELNELTALLAGGADDGQIAAWLNTHGTPRTAEEVRAWSAAFEAERPGRDGSAWFVSECLRLGLDPQQATTCDRMEEDDRQSFAK
ncbi:protein of unknown function [Verrucomicrobium sp. GAS474]|uniref:DUF5069 domain-containing protein n=1 Tax=Verrucomicrobium sp. GAS474 TaxID=1882831 RepID=UPI00087D15E7|nr:DUF5069 domain-containing protein [Verrucomicrobium sp. GAS474]SDT98026.1 protein of unknown function [Verrucomicrobium sp. GAS474]